MGELVAMEWILELLIPEVAFDDVLAFVLLTGSVRQALSQCRSGIARTSPNSPQAAVVTLFSAC